MSSTSVRSHRRLGALSLFALIALVMPAVACDGDSSKDKDPAAATQSDPPKDAKDAKAEAPKKEPPKPKRRAQLQTHRPLLDEAPRAELRSGGLLADFGAVDQHKYTRGGWKNGWGRPENEEDDAKTSYAAVYSTSVVLDVTTTPKDPAPKEVVTRVKTACKNATLTILWDGERAGDADIGSDYALARVSLDPVPDDAFGPGDHEVSVQLRGRCPGKERGHIDWVWLAQEKDATPPEVIERQTSLSIGDTPRRVLAAPDARTYSFYMQVPEDSELVFDYAAAKPGKTFKVFATTDDGTQKELFSKEATTEWTEGVADLKPFAGDVIRLDLATTGDGDAGWGEVEVMVPPKERPTVKGAQPARNVVVILIDTIRADVFEPIGGGEDSPARTPNFDELIKTSTVFANAYDNENWTKPSVATVLSGLYPSTHDAKFQDDVLDKDVELLSERLKANGFATGGLIANGYVSEKFGFKKGWDTYYNYIRMSGSPRAENVYDDAIKFVEENKDDRFFLYVQTIDPHVPYRYHEETTPHYWDGPENTTIGKMLAGKEQAELSGNHTKLTEADYDWIRALYYGEVEYHDIHMGRLIKKLEELGLKEDTLIIITNDHGEELDDHGKMGHGHSLYDELIHGPLLVRYPERVPEGIVYEEPVELVDIAPTMLELLGLDPNGDHEGLSLLPLIEGKPVHRPYYTLTEFLDTRRAVRVGDWKMSGGSSWSKLFNLREDRGEQDNLIDKAPMARRLAEVHIAEGLANPVKRFRQLKTRTGRTFESSDVEMDPELRKQLEALGYFHGD